MASEEALRAAKAIRDERIRGDRRSSLEADAEIIDREFLALRDERDERDELRKALGPRGRADCPKCQGRGTCAGTLAAKISRVRWECECRRELGL